MFRASFEIPGWQILSGIGGVCSCCCCASISILGVADISRNPNLYFEMAILIGKSRRRVNIIIWETSAWAAAHQTASAELKKHKGSRGGDEPWSGGDPFGLPARIRRHVGRGNRREGERGRVRWGG